VRVHEYDGGEVTGTGRGEAFGRRFAEPIATVWVGYRDHFRAVGIPDSVVRDVAESSLIALRDWAPDIAAEIEAMAAGASRPVLDLMALTARTEVLATAVTVDECSTAVHLPAHGAATAFQTWDWHDHLVPEAAVWSYRTDRGRRVRTFTELGMPAKIGLNDAGLSVNFNILHHRSDGDGAGVPVHAVVRRVLDEASTLDEAVDIVRSAPVSASSVLTVLAGDEAASIEIAPGSVAVVRPTGDWLVHTNHFLGAEIADGGVVPPSSTTASRFAHLTDITTRTIDTSSLESLAHGLAPDPAAPICMRPDPALPSYERWQTLLTVRMVPSAEEFAWWSGPPDTVPAAAAHEREA